jgi:hypothetical protein
LEADSDVQVMETAAAVRTDFARTVKPALARCLGYSFEQSAGKAAKLVSARRIPFPRVGTVSAAYRLTVDVTAGTATVRVLFDSVFLGQSRTEYSLYVIALAQLQKQLGPFEARLARTLVARTQA